MLNVGVITTTISGKIVSDVNFQFIYNKDKKEGHTSIAICKMQLDNDSIIDIYGYDEIADYLYQNDRAEYICFEGRLDNNMMVEVYSTFPQ